MYCMSCGAQRADPHSTYCVRCGKPFTAGQQPTAPPAQGHLVGPAPSGPLLSEDPASPMAAAAPQHRGIKALLATVVALVLAILGGAATLASHNNAPPQAVTTAAQTTRPPAHPARTAAQTTTGPGTTQTFPALYRQVSDGVMRIETTACNSGGVGSGFLLSPDLVATVAHVVEGAVSIVIRQNGITTTGTVIGIDTHADLALVRTRTPMTGHVFTLDSSQPEVGTDVGAIGYPLAGQESLTKGAISGLGRTIDVGNGPLTGLIQTDTPLNHGNSGGPLLSVDGTVVGLVDAGSTEGNGIAYAIPAQTASSQLQSWRDAPTPVPAGTGCSAPVGPAGVQATVTDQTANPDGPGIAAAFANYATGINTGNYQQAYAVLSPPAQTLTSYGSFSQGEASSYIVTLSISAITHAGAKDSAAVEFTSVQDPAGGGHGQGCSNWEMTYTLIPGGQGWLIDTASPHPGSPAAC
jgi:serine protease Do